MAVRITEAQTAQVRDDAYVLVTQKETVNGAETEVLRRVAMGDVNKQIEESEWVDGIKREVNGVSIALNTNVQKRLRNLEAAAAGKLYIDDVDDTVAYTKAVDGNVLPYASIDKIGGRSLVWRQIVEPFGGDKTIEGVTFTKVSTGVFRANGTATGTVAFASGGVAMDTPIPAGHKILAKLPHGASAGTVHIEVALYDADGAMFKDVHLDSSSGAIVTLNKTATRYYYAFRVNNGYTCDNVLFSQQLFDLTEMFGVGNEPTTDQFYAMFPNDYYPKNAASIMNFGVNRIVSRGRNLAYMEKWEDKESSGVAFTRVGNSIRIKGTSREGSSSSVVRFDTPIPLKKGATLYVNETSDADCQLYAVVQRGEGSGNIWVNLDYICKDGDYMLYWYYIVKAGATVDLEHIPYVGYMEEVVPYRTPIVCDVSNLVQKYFPDGMKSAGSVYDEIDIENGVAIKRVGSVDLGDLSWSSSGIGSVYERHVSDNTVEIAKPNVGNNTIANAICSNIIADTPDNTYLHTADNTFCIDMNGRVWIYRSEYMGKTGTEVKSLLNGVILHFELAEPVITPIDPDDMIQPYIEVEAGGSLTLENEHGDAYRVPVPNQETYMVKTIGGESV